ncbi:MAG: SAM-dependent methyltransferase, partial [Burkholderiales bacterium]
ARRGAASDRRPGGLLMFSALGVDSLRELRAAGASTMTFQDMHDIGDALLAVGFAEPVMDMETLNLGYRSTEALVADLRALGGNALRARRAGLAGRRWLRQAHSALHEHCRKPAGDGHGLTFEVVYGHAWAPKPRGMPQGYAPVRFVPRAR